jgi:hypothetical protein
MVCHGQHTYVYSQVIIHVLARESKGGSSMKRLSQEITKCAQKKFVFFQMLKLGFHLLVLVAMMLLP